MGIAISIPKALEAMDSFFGCEIIHTKNENGKEVISFRKKNFVDWILDIVSNLENHPATREKTVAALVKLVEEIKEAESGQFESLVKKYVSSDAKIDFIEIKRTLKQALSWELPPVVFTRDANEKSDLTLVAAYRDMHIKNLKKCICLEEDAVPLTSDPSFKDVSDANISGFCESLDSFSEQHNLPEAYFEPISHYGNRQTEIRVQLAAYELLKEKGDQPTEEDKTQINKLKHELEKLLEKEVGDSWEYDKTTYTDMYYSKLQEIIDNPLGLDNTYEVEILVSRDGTISDENIDGLAEALLKFDPPKNGISDASIQGNLQNKAPFFERKNFDFIISEKAVEAKSDILIRINDARIECLETHVDRTANATLC